MHLIAHHPQSQYISQQHQHHSLSHQPHSISTPPHHVHPALTSAHREYAYPHNSYPTSIYYANHSVQQQHQQQVPPVSYVILHSQDSVNRYQVGNSNRYEAGQQEILKNGSAAQSGSLNQYATSGQQQQVQQYQVSCMRRLPSISRTHQGAILGNSPRISN